MHCPKGTQKKASIMMNILLPKFLCIKVITAPCAPAQSVPLVLRVDRQLQSDALLPCKSLPLNCPSRGQHFIDHG